jgi:uncharacterized protein YecT (DUF1311 family)
MIKFVTLFFISLSAHSACLDNAYTTLDISECHIEEYKVEGQKLESTLLQAYSKSDWITNEIKLSQEVWMKYRDAHCGAIYTSYGRGTMRLIAHPSCMVELTKQRQKELYTNFVKDL